MDDEEHIRAGVEPVFWALLIGVWLFTVLTWALIRASSGYGSLTMDGYMRVAKAIESYGTGCSSWTIESMPVLNVLQIIRQLSLWLALTFYIFRGALPSAGDGIFIATAALCFAGVVFFSVAEAAFWFFGAFGWTFGLRIIEALLFFVALITAIVELSHIASPDSCAASVALIIVLSIIFFHEVLVLLPRNYYFSRYRKTRFADNHHNQQHHHHAGYVRAANVLEGGRSVSSYAQPSQLGVSLSTSRASSAAFH
jgi:hypothetical protein